MPFAECLLKGWLHAPMRDASANWHYRSNIVLGISRLLWHAHVHLPSPSCPQPPPGSKRRSCKAGLSLALCVRSEMSPHLLRGKNAAAAVRPRTTGAGMHSSVAAAVSPCSAPFKSAAIFHNASQVWVVRSRGKGKQRKKDGAKDGGKWGTTQPAANKVCHRGARESCRPCLLRPTLPAARAAAACSAG